MQNDDTDSWMGLSADLIERFLDVAVLERQLSRTARRGCLSDLRTVDDWMRRATGHTLVAARTEDLWACFRRQIADGIEARLLDRLLANMRGFYAYLQATGCREDDPAAALPDWVHHADDHRGSAEFEVVRHAGA